MKFEDFTSGKFVQQYEYKSFTPTLVNREWTWEDPRINSLLEETTRSLAELDAFSKMVPDVDRYIYMHVVKEANTLIEEMVRLGILEEMTGLQRNREYLFTEYYRLFLD